LLPRLSGGGGVAPSQTSPSRLSQDRQSYRNPAAAAAAGAATNSDHPVGAATVRATASQLEYNNNDIIILILIPFLGFLSPLSPRGNPVPWMSHGH